MLVEDPQYLTRKGLIGLIDSLCDFEVVDDSFDAEWPLIEKISELKPDVVVVGLVEEDIRLIDELEEIEKTKKSSFLIITGVYKQIIVQKLVNTGVRGILTKTCSEEEIVSGLRAVAENNRFYCNTILDIVVNKDESGDCDPTVLSEREYQVLELIAKGLKTNQIADQLFLSVHTVNSHRKSILKKLNVKSPTELIVYAMETGLVASKGYPSV